MRDCILASIDRALDPESCAVLLVPACSYTPRSFTHCRKKNGGEQENQTKTEKGGRRRGGKGQTPGDCASGAVWAKPSVWCCTLEWSWGLEAKVALGGMPDRGPGGSSAQCLIGIIVFIHS